MNLRKNLHLALFAIFASSFLFMSCEKDEVELPKLTTSVVSGITSISSLAGGEISSDGGGAIKARGVCWGTSPNPTEGLSTKTNDGSGKGNFTSIITGLVGSTTYYMRAYATNSAGTAYGNELSFTTLAPPNLPVLVTSEPVSITENSAGSGGDITSDGGGAITARSVCWSTSTNPTVALSTKTSNGAGTGVFTGVLTGLAPTTLYYVRAYATNLAGTAYGNEFTFTTTAAPTVAVLTTVAPTSITETTAMSGGNITSDGGKVITARGVCWSTNTNPTISLATKTTDGTGDGYFTSSITGLTNSITYYVRAYATNSVGTTYGAEYSFETGISPSITTSANVYAITSTSALCGGNVINGGGLPVTARGVCWSINNNPTIADSKTNDGSGTGSFTSSLTGLQPGTLYYVRAYATNTSVTGYGEEKTFTTLNVPTVVTADITDISGLTATGGGEVTSDGGVAVTARGVCWSTNENPTIANSKTTDGAGMGTFVSSIVDLQPGITYYVRAYATNSIGTAYGAQRTFTTNITLPVITTTIATSITISSAISGGNVTQTGGAEVIARGVCWSTSPNPTLDNNQTSNGSGLGAFISNLTSLLNSTTYYVRAYAVTSAGTAYGNEVVFNTPSLPVLTTNNNTGIVGYSTNSGGNVTSDGGAAVTARGVCWSTSPNPTNTLATKTNNGTGIGPFNGILTELSLSTTYYVRAYATNSVGTAYGNEISFTTIAIGSDYQGGKIAYVFQAGDPGYVAGEAHGLIAAPYDQSAGVKWGNGINLNTGADLRGLGGGNANTIAIVATQGDGSYAAKLCADLVLGGYSDWYLPSIEELIRVYINRDAIGGFFTIELTGAPDDYSTHYWSSTQELTGTFAAWNQKFRTELGREIGYQSLHEWQYTLRVRAIRTF